jgi:hypothetical protein
MQKCMPEHDDVFHIIIVHLWNGKITLIRNVTF